MFARVSTYGIVIAALLMTACSQNETEQMTASVGEPVAISFSFSALTTENGATTRGEAEDAQLRNTGFGVFATVEGSTIPNLMYNQKVTYTYLADDNYLLDEEENLTSEAKNGYWSYSPTKYWPMKVNNEGTNVPQTVTFCAYAPYVATGGATGITGVSPNNKAPYLDYTISEKLDETVDLLWNCYQPSALTPITFKMYHALARVAVNVVLEDNNGYKNDNNKVLISEITLSTAAAVTKGQLKLDDDHTETNNQEEVLHYPTWTTQSTGSRTVKIQNTDNSDSYGIIAEDIRYINDLPYSWQPEGLQLKHVQKEDETWIWEGVVANALCAPNHPLAYIYFIPNEVGLTLSCTVYYTLMDNGGGIHNDHRTAGVAIKPLRGNRTYQLNLIIDPPTP